MADDRPHMTAILAALNAELAPDREAYARGKVPGLDGNNDGDQVEPAIYAIVDLVRRGGNPALRNVRTDRRSHRVTVRGVGRSVSEAQWALARASDALEGAALTISGARTTPLVFESGVAVAPDKGRYSGSLTWTYGT